MRKVTRILQLIMLCGFILMTPLTAHAEGTKATSSEPPAPTPLPPVGNTFNFGQQVWVKEGTVYFESADRNGSGKSYTANNAYTASLRVNGFARVDSDGNLIAYKCIPASAIADATSTAQDGQELELPGFMFYCYEGKIWLSTYSETAPGGVGWFKASEVYTRKPEAIEATSTDQPETTTSEESDTKKKLDRWIMRRMLAHAEIYYYKSTQLPKPMKDPVNLPNGSVDDRSNLDN